MPIRSSCSLRLPCRAGERPARRFFLLIITVSSLWASSATAGGPALDGGSTVQDLKFAAFFRQPVGPHGLEQSESLRSAHGQRVRIVGYMVAQEQPPAGRFLLTLRPVRMSEHADGDADDLPPATVLVMLPPGQRERVIRHHEGLVEVEGRLSVGRAEDDTGRVTWVQLQLDPEAMPSISAKPPSPP
jgi:hypothetical protein